VWQGREVRDTGLDASSGEDLRDVVVTLTDQTIELGGIVTGPNGPQVAAVIAFPVDRARGINFGLRPSNFDVTRSASSGTLIGWTGWRRRYYPSRWTRRSAMPGWTRGSSLRPRHWQRASA
jgi:hypothetical protein